jgi:hypothetical protein
MRSLPRRKGSINRAPHSIDAAAEDAAVGTTDAAWERMIRQPADVTDARSTRTQGRGEDEGVAITTGG